jgi:enoyl-CoA hydratase/carnithine racemase
MFSAEEALAGGLVNYVVPHDQLMEKANEIGWEIANKSSAISIPLNRQLLWKMLGADHPMESHKIESKSIYWQGLKADSKEAIAAFHEKRSPQFTMKPSTDMPEFYPWWKERPF